MFFPLIWSIPSPPQLRHHYVFSRLKQPLIWSNCSGPLPFLYYFKSIQFQKLNLHHFDFLFGKFLKPILHFFHLIFAFPHLKPTSHKKLHIYFGYIKPQGYLYRK